MKKITFLIGNGFDINVGFNTRYSDFIKYYLHQASQSPLIKQFKDNIIRDQEMWADAEIAFGNITAEYLTTTEFLSCYKDFCINLSYYLIEQTSNINYADTQVKSNMLSALLKYSNLLTESQKRKITNLYSNLSGSYIFNFVNFNYTDIFDHCIDVLRIADKSLIVYNLDSIDYRMELGDVIHIHGDLNSAMLLGVNADDQVANKEFLKNRKFKRQFIKPLTNVGLQTLRDERTKNIIADSDVICIYGMSLGATDKIWWEQIISWLQKDKSNYLVIFTYSSIYNLNLSSSFLDTEEDVQNRLFSYFQLSEQEKDALRDQVFVAVNRPLFNFKLTKIAENKKSA